MIPGVDYRFSLSLPGALVAALFLAACAGKPLYPWTNESQPLALVPVADAGVDDQRGRFREIYCEVLESRGPDWPDYIPCDQALTRVGTEPGATKQQVAMGDSAADLLALIVPGLGWECIENWLKIDASMNELISNFGYGAQALKVDGLSSSTHNARQIRDAVLALPEEYAHRPLLLIGYSKGAPDILEAIVTYPELARRVTAVLSSAGAIGGSPLANSADQTDLNLMRLFPGSECSVGDGGAMESLRPDIRRAWLAEHRLPPGIAYYSLVTYPSPERISNALSGMYKKLSQVDARNDGQLIYYDQVIPGSTLLGFVNADHWALAVPIARQHRLIGSTFVDQNAYPREALVEAALRFVEEDLARRSDAGRADPATQ